MHVDRAHAAHISLACTCCGTFNLICYFASLPLPIFLFLCYNPPQRHLLDRGMLHRNLLPIQVWRGLAASIDALQAVEDEAKQPNAKRAKHVVWTQSNNNTKTTTTTLNGTSSVNAGPSKRSFSTTARRHAPSIIAPPASSGVVTEPPFRLAMFASSEFSIPTLHALRRHADELLVGGRATIITPADKPTGRGRVIQPSAFKLEALKLGFDVIQMPIDIDFRMTGWELPESLRGSVDVGVVVSFGYMLPATIINEFPSGIINIHPSLLPRYRGSSPIQFALAHGDAETGVSIIDVHPTQIDGGNIIHQSTMVRTTTDRFTRGG